MPIYAVSGRATPHKPLSGFNKTVYEGWPSSIDACKFSLRDLPPTGEYFFVSVLPLF